MTLLRWLNTRAIALLVSVVRNEMRNDDAISWAENDERLLRLFLRVTTQEIS